MHTLFHSTELKLILHSVLLQLVKYNFQEKTIICVINHHTICQGMRYIRSMSYTLLTITELPNNELTGIHTRDLPALALVTLNEQPIVLPCKQ